MSAKKSVVIFPNSTRSNDPRVLLLEVKDFINQISQSNKYSITLLLNSNEKIVEHVRENYHLYGINNLIEIQSVPQPNQSIIYLKKKIEYFLRIVFKDKSLEPIILNSLPIVLLFSFIDFLWIVHAKIIANRIYQCYLPDIYIIQRERTISVSTALLKIARKNNTKTVVLPSSYTNIGYSIVNRKNEPRNWMDGSHVSIVQRLSKKYDPFQIMTWKNRSYSFYKPSIYLASLISGLKPSRPWITGNDVDYCCVDSLHTKETLKNYGLENNNIIVTGDPSLDRVYCKTGERKSRYRQLLDKYGIDENKKIILIALPHLKEHNICSNKDHWNNIHHILNHATNDNRYCVLVSLHPRCLRSEYTFLEDQYDIYILDDNIRNIIAFCDYFICSWSGTTIIGPTLGIPTLVMNWFGVPYLGYDYIFKYIICVNEIGEFPNAVRKLKEKTKNNNSVSNKLPLVDGLSAKRIYEFHRRNFLMKYNKKILFLVTSGQYFLSHRKLLAIKCRDSGYEIIVACNGQKFAKEIKDLNFKYAYIPFHRTRVNPIFEIQTIWKIVQLYRQEKPDIVHHIAMKASLYGAIAARIVNVSRVINTIAGLGYVFISNDVKARIVRAFYYILHKIGHVKNSHTFVFQNDDDKGLIESYFGLQNKDTALIRGSGVDINKFKPQINDSKVKNIIFPARMLISKGIMDFVQASKIFQNKNLKNKILFDWRYRSHIILMQYQWI